MRKIPFPTPGEILLVEFLKPLRITQRKLAAETGIPQHLIEQIVSGASAITPAIGVRLSRFFNMSDGFWTGLQLDYDAAQETMQG